jgi:hypothetical protein
MKVAVALDATNAATHRTTDSAEQSVPDTDA